MSDVPEMIERVARAMALSIGAGWLPQPMPQSHLHHWRGLARAAMEAMREPTEEMVELWDGVHPPPDEIYRAMIAAALGKAKP